MRSAVPVVTAATGAAIAMAAALAAGAPWQGLIVPGAGNTMDIPQRQVLVHFPADALRLFWQHRILVVRVVLMF